MAMKGNLFGFKLLLLLVLLNGCSASKIDYKTAYKFSYYNYQKEKPSDDHSPSLIASTRPAPIQLPSKAISEGLNPAIPDASTLSNLKPVTEELPKGLSKAEKRAFRKVVRNKFKEIRSEYRKELQSDKKTSQDAKKNWRAYTGFMMGILAWLGLLFIWLDINLRVISPVLIFLAFPGLFFSIVGLKSEKKTFAIIGLALSILMFVFGAIIAVIFVAYLLYGDRN